MVSRADPNTEFFPGANPHPVMRVTDDGDLIYANVASQPVLDALGLVVGQPVPAEWLERLMTTEGPIDVRVGPRTFELLAVRLRDLRFTNVYGTDVTAQRAITKFPDQNPNPVFRISLDGVLVYINGAAHDLIDGLGGRLGEPMPQPYRDDLQSAAREGQRRSVVVRSRDRDYALLAVDVPEFEFTNVYGTDITAQLQIEALNRQNVQLLLNILPEPIADRLRAGEALIADRHEDVSLLFADIVGFTDMSSTMDASELVRLLNEVFSVFDGLVDASGLEKVKTIGDAYMIVGGMPIWQPDHLDRMAGLALDIADAVAHNDAAARLGVRFRIGINTGPVVAGVIGTRRWIYDVWGDTVNVASRMESTGIAGRVQVTPAVEQRLRGRFRLESRGEQRIKGKGVMETFFLVDRV
ncbi:MAG TPA: adenylate/guanylate cyclase domain-containing protein [Candidatus Limnocylindrales bacterium]|nr:adenylate/guanylate cyclase domain-containing protein [Candidatus Limnocylindrales bacterium]